MRRMRAVVAITDGQETVHPSVNQAVQATGINRPRILQACADGQGVKRPDDGVVWMFRWAGQETAVAVTTPAAATVEKTSRKQLPAAEGGDGLAQAIAALYAELDRLEERRLALTNAIAALEVLRG